MKDLLKSSSSNVAREISSASLMLDKFIIVGGFQRTGTNYLRNLVFSVMDNRSQLLPIFLHSFLDIPVKDNFIYSPNLTYIFPVRPVKETLASLIVMWEIENFTPDEAFVFLKKDYKLFGLHSYLRLAHKPFKNTFAISLEDIKGGDTSQVTKVLLQNNIKVSDQRYSAFEALDAREKIGNEIRSNSVPVSSIEKQIALEKAYKILGSKVFVDLVLDLEKKYALAMDTINSREWKD